jgi:hypothetical protein
MVEDKQQQQQVDTAVQPRRSSQLVESPLTKETQINTNKNRRVLPTQRNRSSPVARKQSASVVSFADTSVLTMPPKKKQKTSKMTNKKKASTPAKKPVRVNFTGTEDICICKAWINVSQNAITGNDQKGLMFWSKVHSMFLELVRQNKDDLPARAREVRKDKTAVKN